MQHLQLILNKAVDNKRIFGTTFAIKTQSQSWIGSSGNFSNSQQFFIASTTKLFTTALILNLLFEKKLTLEDKISKYFDAELMKGLHFFKGVDYSNTLTIKHLLSHTSGFPDYFQSKSEHNLWKKLTQNFDQKWTFHDTIELTKKTKPLFAPGYKNKAHYSDTNFQLLGKIIENITNKSYNENLQEKILTPAELKETYLFSDNQDNRPKLIYFKNKELNIPLAMSSFGADGGLVSTSSDLLVFIEAFFNGRFFPKNYIETLQKWNNIFFPLKSGIGMHLFKLPRIFDPFQKVPYFIGHSGLSGALAYYCPKYQFYIVGTTNQSAYPSLSFKLMIKLTQSLMKQESI